MKEENTQQVQISGYVTGKTTYDAIVLFESIEVDGVEFDLSGVDKGKISMSSGEHTIKYTLIDETTLSSYAFYTCPNMTSITIPSSVTSIGNHAFKDCTGLTSVTIPSNVTSINNSAFQGCTGLTSITIPSSVTSIGNLAFKDCTGLTSIDIPGSVTTIGNEAFQGCTGLTSIIVDADNSVYDSRNNCNAVNETSTNKLIFGCKNTVIPNTITSIGNSAFHNCTDLTLIVLPDGLITIEERGFYGCNDLIEITLPDSINSIGYMAFSECNGLASITCRATTPPTLSENPVVFHDQFDNNCPIYVPAASVDTYKSASGWSIYASRIQAIP